MTSAPCQQWPYCGELPPSGCVECGAPHWTAPRLCVISCRKPSGHQPQRAVPGTAAPSRLKRIEVRPPRLWMFAEPWRSPVEPITVSPRPYSCEEPDRPSASTIALRGPPAAPSARWTAAGDRGEVVGVGGARARQLDGLDVHVLRTAGGAHVEAQALGAAVLGGQEALDDRHVGLQRVLPAGEAVRAVGGVGVDELELGLGGGRDRAVVAAGLVAAPRGGEAVGTVAGGRLGGRDDVGEVDVLQLGARVAVREQVRVGCAERRTWAAPAARARTQQHLWAGGGSSCPG